MKRDRPVKGFWASLTGEQRAKALAYRGPENIGSAEFRNDEEGHMEGAVKDEAVADQTPDDAGKAVRAEISEVAQRLEDLINKAGGAMVLAMSIGEKYITSCHGERLGCLGLVGELQYAVSHQNRVKSSVLAFDITELFRKDEPDEEAPKAN